MSARKHMRPGQRVTVKVDAIGGKEFTGKVDSLAAATGARFALLPPENATGNWVKVVQRLPVRLAFENLDPQTPLHAGLSVNVEVDTHHRRPWLVRFDRFFAWLKGGGATRTAER